MAPTREEREEQRQQRIRGAQMHQVKDVSFGLIFPPAPAAAESTTDKENEAPPPTPPSAPTQQTPAPRGRGRPPGSGKKQSRDAKTPGANEANTSANTSVKRARLDGPAPASDRSLRSSERRSSERRSSEGVQRTDIYEIEADEGDEEPQLQVEQSTTEHQTVQVVIPSRRSSPLNRRQATPPSRNDEMEISESPADAPGSGHRQRVDAATAQTPAAASRQPATSETSGGLFVSEASSAPRRSPRRSPRNQPGPSPELGGDTTMTSNVEDSNVADDELSPEQSSSRIQLDESRLSQQEQEQEEEPEEPEEEPEEAEEVDDVEAATVLDKNRKRRRSPEADLIDDVASEAEEGEEEEEEEEQEEEEQAESDDAEASRYVPTPKPQPQPQQRKRGRPKASPVAQRQPKRAKTAAKATASAPAPRKNFTRAGSPIPITVHRLTAPTGPYVSEDPESGVLRGGIPQAKRSGVNAVDVLSQICEELLESGLTALEDGFLQCDDAAERKEYRTKIRAVEAFQEELKTRLLEITIGLDNNYALQKRVKEAEKERQGLREDLLKIRREREEVALRMDAVRERHERESGEAEKRQALNTSLQDLELAVSRGRQAGDNIEAETPALPTLQELDLRIQNTANLASSKSDEGGILKKVKEFNKFLERAATLLERRGAAGTGK